MRRWIVRICSFAFAVVVGICSIQTVQGIQKLAPFGSTVTFRFNIISSVETKDALAQDLAAIGKDLGTTIGKVSPNPEKYKTDRDVFLFSGSLDSNVGPVVKQGQVFWLNQKMSGRVLDYEEMGGRSLNGEYFAVDAPGLRQSIQAWAKTNAISVDWGDVSYLASGQSITRGMLLSATGLLIPACFLLVLAAASISLQKRWKQQKVELTEGKPYWKVRLESARENLLPLLQGSVLGVLATVLYLALLPEGAAQAKAVVSVCAGSALFFFLAVFLAVSLLSVFSVPSLKALGIRDNTSKTLKAFALILELSGTTVVIVALAMTLSAINVQSQSLGQADAYAAKLPDATRLSLLATPTGAPETEKEKVLFSNMIRQAESSNVLMVSLYVGQGMSLREGDLAGFDHFVIANKTYLDAMGIGIDSPGPSGALYEIPAGDVPPFPTVQTPIWLAEGSRAEPSFYRYVGEGMLCQGQNPGKGGESVVCENPCVLIVDGLATGWSYDNFVLPLLSTGNIFFSDYQSARELVDESGASDLVASIDNMWELVLQAVQDFSMVIQVLSVSVVVSLIIVITVSFQAAVSWCVASSKLIFAQRCSGRSLADMATGKLAGRLAITAAASLIGFSVEAFIIKNDFLLSAGVALAVFAVVALCQIAFRCRLASNMFHKTAIRR